jgi:NTP pyrophosphatase (non-canonical NTP hydrolase)
MEGQMGNVISWAKNELELAGYFETDGLYGDLLGNAVLGMIEHFAEQGHSGMSANAAAAIFDRLVHHLPLTPLTGADDEWVEIAEDGDGSVTLQNKRCSSVFKIINRTETGAVGEHFEAYDQDGYVFQSREDGSRFTSVESRKPIEFPYTPTAPVVLWEDSKEPVDAPGLTFAAYQEQAISTAVYAEKIAKEHAEMPALALRLFRLMYVALGLAGEGGEFADCMKKVIRDDGGTIDAVRLDKLKKELGDCLWYIANAAQELGISMEDIARTNNAKLQGRQERGTLCGDGALR